MNRYLAFAGDLLDPSGPFGAYRGSYDDLMLACAVGIDDEWIDIFDTHTGLWCSADAGAPHKWTEWRSALTDNWDTEFCRDSPPKELSRKWHHDGATPTRDPG